MARSAAEAGAVRWPVLGVPVVGVAVMVWLMSCPPVILISVWMSSVLRIPSAIYTLTVR